MSKLNFHQYIKTAKPKKKDRDFCTRSASAQFHPGLTEVTQRSFCFSQTFLVLLNMRNSIERICLEIQDLQKKENDEDFHPATKQKRLRRRLPKVLAAATSNPKSASSHCQRNSKERELATKFFQKKSGAAHFADSLISMQQSSLGLKITEYVSFNITSEASYANILSGHHIKCQKFTILASF